MAVYVPLQIISNKAMGNGSANIGTWQVQNTLGAGDFYIHRTTTLEDPNGSSISIELGATAATTTSQRIMDAQAIVAHITFIQNWWVAQPNNAYFGGFANTATTNAQTGGYQFS
jgi:hypothetical protein